MRVNVYAEEMTERIEIISKEIDGQTFTGLRIYLALPVTLPRDAIDPIHGKPVRGNLEFENARGVAHVSGPFKHREDDDDSSAVTFWGKRDLRIVLSMALAALDDHYAERDRARDGASA